MISCSYFRRIGSILTNGSAQIQCFSQNGDEFLWCTPFNDINTTSLGTTATLYPLTVPTGLKVTARLRGYSLSASGNDTLVSSPDEASAAVLAVGGNITTTAGSASQAYGTLMVDVRTSTSGQVRAVSTGASTTLTTATYGWVDTRGRFN